MKTTYDYPRLSSDSTGTWLRPTTLEELQTIVKRRQARPLVIGGSRKSHGAHLRSAQPHDYVDMTTLNAIEGLEDSVLTVQAGCTWQAVQEYLQPHGLSPICQQSSYDFTVGGSIAGNIHGRDIHASSIEHSVAWIELLLADGTTRTVSRDEQPELFWLLFGSQGALGIITRVGLRVTANTRLRLSSLVLPCAKLNDWFEANRKAIDFLIVRPSISDDLKLGLVSAWTAGSEVSHDALGQEKNWRRDKLVFWASGLHPLFMKGRWRLETLLAGNDRWTSRTNAMRPPVTPLKMFGTTSKRFSYAVQEIFVPKAKLETALAAINEYNKDQQDIRLMGVTLRHISKQQAPLGYAREGERWAIMQYWKVPRTEIGLGRYAHLQKRLFELCASVGGKVYLSYASLLPPQSILGMYPALKELRATKQRLDPDQIFTSDFISRLLSLSE